MSTDDALIATWYYTINEVIAQHKYEEQLIRQQYDIMKEYKNIDHFRHIQSRRWIIARDQIDVLNTMDRINNIDDINDQMIHEYLLNNYTFIPGCGYFSQEELIEC